MPDIAKLDEDGLLIAVETVSEDEHVTDIAAGTFALPHNHDMRLHIKNYRWDVRRGHFVPLSMQPLEEEERATPELVEGIVEALEDIYEKLGNKSAARRAAGAVESASEAAADLVMPERTKRVFEQFRRHVPRRKPQTIEISSARIAAAEASLANNPPATGGEATAATKPENRADLSTAKGKP